MIVFIADTSIGLIIFTKLLFTKSKNYFTLNSVHFTPYRKHVDGM